MEEGGAPDSPAHRLLYFMGDANFSARSKCGNGDTPAAVPVRLQATLTSSAATGVTVRLGDVLCGTKLVARHDYARMVKWRRDFGDFDPFGDFELIFPAAVLAIGTVDVPIRYRARIRIRDIDPRVVHIDLRVVALKRPHDVHDLRVAHVGTVLFERETQHQHARIAPRQAL